MINKLRENYCYHNVLDFFIGLIMLISYLQIGEKAFSFFALYVLHLVLNRKPDEREQILNARSYAIAFNLILGLLWIFDFYFQSFFKPMIILAFFIGIKGLVGILVFSRG